MGYIHTRWVLESHGLTPTEKIVLMCLTYHAHNVTRQTWVSTTTIAIECGYSPTSRGTVRRALQSLRSKGFISYEQQKPGQGEKQTSNTYTVHWQLTSDSGGGARTDTLSPRGKSNHHKGRTPGSRDTRPLAQELPDTGSRDTTNREPNLEVLTGNGFTSDSGESDMKTVSPASSRNGERGKASGNDPIGEAFYRSSDRQTLIASVQHYATIFSEQGAGSAVDEAMSLFEHNLSVAFPDADLADWLSWDIGWTPPKKCKDKYEAAKWLNKFLHSWKQEIGQLGWRGQP